MKNILGEKEGFTKVLYVMTMEVTGISDMTMNMIAVVERMVSYKDKYIIKDKSRDIR